MSGLKEHQLIQLAKGVIAPADLAVGGTLTPQEADKIISMVYDDPFLKKINTIRMAKLKRNVDVFDIADRQLVRVAQGEEPTNAQLAGAGEHGCVLTALDVQLFASLTLDFLRENKGNPNLVREVEAGFSTKLTGDLTDLAFNGTADDNSAGFLTLNKGWVQIATEELVGDLASRAIDIDPATDTWRTTLGTLRDAADQRWRASSVFVMSVRDADAYADELGVHVTGTPLTADSPLRRFSGIPIEANKYMPDGHVLYTPLKNLTMGMHTTIQRDRAYHARKRALEYTFDMAVDYEIAVKQAVVLGKPAPAP